MALVNDEVVGKYVERDARDVHLIQTGCFVGTISDETLITATRGKLSADMAVDYRATYKGAVSRLKITYGS